MGIMEKKMETTILEQGIYWGYSPPKSVSSPHFIATYFGVQEAIAPLNAAAYFVAPFQVLLVFLGLNPRP